MPTTFNPADDDVSALLLRVMKHWHSTLHTAGVKIGILMAYNPEGHAVTHGGYRALAKIKVVSARDRVRKNIEAEIEIDESLWRDLKQEQRIALLDHELSHIKLIPLSPEQLRAAQAYSATANWWKIDDHGRPKLKTVKGDWNVGDGFKAVVMRHGENAIELQNIVEAEARVQVFCKEGEEEREQTLLTFLEDSKGPSTLKIPMAKA
jgi:hypothetical protein